MYKEVTEQGYCFNKFSAKLLQNTNFIVQYI